MNWTQYGIKLSLIQETDIELIRNWRNNPAINRYMEYRNFITAEMQAEWFLNINNIQNFFFIIEHNEQKVGLISTSKINIQTKTAECGIFIWHEQSVGSHVPVFAVLAMLNFVFYFLPVNTTCIKVHRENFKARRYNEALGYQPLTKTGIGENLFLHYELTKENYLLNTENLRKLGGKKVGNQAILNIGKNQHGIYLLQRLNETSLQQEIPFSLIVETDC
ncbi:MAG: GNAT family N-acetyltransferase [Sphingobacteriales bacterium]|nr:MAG: GNAT family N-acetyltransferase [Sphingobacteriales bacterium]